MKNNHNPVGGHPEKKASPPETATIRPHLPLSGTGEETAGKRWPEGAKIGESYTVLAFLGEGSSGVVYRVRNEEKGLVEALKIPPPHLLGTPTALETFLHEARVAENLRHPNLVSIHRVGLLSETNQVFFTMALMPGGDLGQLLERSVLNNAPLATDRVLKWMGEVALALAYLHSRGLVHQDLKPANILLDENNHARLGDFGLAFMPKGDKVRDHLRQSTVIGGTTYFMSPEQYQAIFYRKNVPITPASDVCAFGLTLYNLISGEIIVGNREPMAEFVSDPDLAVALDRFLSKCLARKPEKRFATGQDLLLDYRQLLTLVPRRVAKGPIPKRGLLSRFKAKTFQDGMTPGTCRRVALGHGCELIMVWVPPGRFQMGSELNEVGRHQDEGLHEVTLTRGFWMAETPVTQKQWLAIMGNQPSFHKGKNLPVEMVSWEDVKVFLENCAKLQQAILFQLPSEAQWEYACRAGSTTPFAGKVNGLAWHAGNSRQTTHRVGSRKKNAWGLYDMHGNVWEWCLDYYDTYPNQSITDPVGPRRGEHRVIRGGSFDYGAKYCRAAARFRYLPGNKNINLGFRLIALPD